MFEVELPSEMSAQRFDRRLAQGWFRSGPAFFRADMICLEDEVRGLVHIRLPLDGDLPSKSRRRRLRRNREIFRCVLGPAQVDSERQRLYEAMKPRFMSFVARDLESIVFSGSPHVFDTRECSVYDGDRLVAVSYFDVGQEGVASQLALHDPSYARFGLGFYTILEEIEYARSCGARFFYPGYLVPGLSGFDYKLEIGAVQYLEAKGRWRRRAHPPQRVRCAERYSQRFRALGRALEREGVPYRRHFYPGFWIGYLDGAEVRKGSYLRGVAHIRCAPDESGGVILVIEYSEEDDEYLLSHARVDRDVDLLDEYDPMEEPLDHYEMRALVYDSLCFRGSSAREVAQAARDELGRT